MSVSSDVVVIFFSSIVVLTPQGNTWIVPLVYPVSDMSSPSQRLSLYRPNNTSRNYDATVYIIRSILLLFSRY